MLDFVGKTIDLDRLADVLPDYRFAYFITVDDDYRAHATTVTPRYAAGVFDIGPVGRHGRANLSDRSGVTLVFPPRKMDEYSLIIDGHAEVPADPAQPVQVTPRRALLHRPAGQGRDEPVGPGFDCVQLTRP